MEHILSRVRSMPWKLVRQFLPWTSSVMSLNLRNATSSFCRSARLTSNTRPFRPSEAIPIRHKVVCQDWDSFSVYLEMSLITSTLYAYSQQWVCLHAPDRFWVYLLVPWVLVTKVLPRLRMLNMAGALTSYQSFLEKGSTLQSYRGQRVVLLNNAYTLHYVMQY